MSLKDIKKNKNIFKVFLMSIGKVFHNEATAVSIKRLLHTSQFNLY